mgnify:FL=1
MARSQPGPVFIIGAARSGTNMLGSIFNMHPDTFYTGENNYVWRIGNAGLKTDVIPRTALNPRICQAIRNRFRVPRDRMLVEKTAANSLRLPFILKVFPSARIVHIVRDGRDVAVSAREKWQGRYSVFEKEELGYGSRRKAMVFRIWKRMLSRDISIWNIHNYLTTGLGMIKSVMGLSNFSIWGPQFPGIQELSESHSLIEVCAFQWLSSVESVMNFHKNNPSVPYLEVKYETLTTSPRSEIARVYDFCGLEDQENIETIIENVKSGNTMKWVNQLTGEEIDELHNIIYVMLELFDYPLNKEEVRTTRGEMRNTV